MSEDPKFNFFTDGESNSLEKLGKDMISSSLSSCKLLYLSSLLNLLLKDLNTFHSSLESP